MEKQRGHKSSVRFGGKQAARNPKQSPVEQAVVILRKAREGCIDGQSGVPESRAGVHEDEGQEVQEREERVRPKRTVRIVYVNGRPYQIRNKRDLARIMENQR